MPAFVHLTAKSAFSLREGVIRPHELAVAAWERGMDTIGIADRGGLYGAVRLAQACEAVGVRPLYGADLALDPYGATAAAPLHRPRASRPRAIRPGWEDRRARGTHKGPGAGSAWLEGDPARVTLLARTQAGYAHLARTITACHLESLRGEPHVTWEQLTRHPQGWFVLLGDESPVGRLLDAGRLDAAAVEARAWMDLAGPGNVLVGVTHHRARHDDARARARFALADRLGLTAVAHQEPRYLDPGDARLADVMDAVRGQVPLGPPVHASGAARLRSVPAHASGAARLRSVPAHASGAARLRSVPAHASGAARLRSVPVHSRRRNAEGYLKTPEEMAAVFAERPDAIANTAWVAEQCDVDLGLGKLRAPDLAGAADAQAELRGRCLAGLHARYANPGRAHHDRLDDELAMITHLGLASYFLTVAEVTDRIRSKDVFVACRGSAAGSLVCHLLGISDVDPLAHDLCFERFMNPYRDELPDIDLDVESARREDVYADLLARYGEDRVACVAMVETFKARMAIREVGKAVGLPAGEVDHLATAFPHIRARDVRTAAEQLPELADVDCDRDDLALVFDVVERLDGLPRHVALHPSGVILADAGLRDLVPCETAAAGFAMAQFDKDDVAALGLCKLDVLAVRMLSSMRHCVDEVARVRGTELDVETIPTDDEAAYALVRSTRTLGCFQIESPGQRELLGKLQPTRLDDLVVDISLFRPGPVKSDMVTPFLARRHGHEPARAPHPLLEEALAETHGVIVYHEQVMRCVATLTGCDLSTADLVRRRLDDDEMVDELRGWVLDGARAQGLPDDTAAAVWDALAQFASFGFCKAHAAAFAVPTYRSAWLKAHYLPELFAGLLTHDPGMYPRRLLLDDARQFGVAVAPLDVNRSDRAYRVERIPASEALASLGVDGDRLPPGWATGASSDAPGGRGSEWRTGEGTLVPPAGVDLGADPADPTWRFALRVALDSVAGIDDAMIDSVLANRPFTSVADLRRRSCLSAPVAEGLTHAGALDGLAPEGANRRDVLLEVSERWSGVARYRPADRGRPEQLALLGGGEPSGLADYTRAERVRAELEVCGLDVTMPVIRFYDDLLDLLGVTRAGDLLTCSSGRRVRVAGVKVATQTPPVRSGQRVIFLSLDDATGVADTAFFESVHDRCARTVFHSWLLVAEGTVRRTGARGVSVNADTAWDLRRLMHAWREGRLDEALAGAADGGRAERGRQAAASSPGGSGDPTRYDVGGTAPRRLWHASGGSAG